MLQFSLPYNSFPFSRTKVNNLPKLSLENPPVAIVLAQFTLATPTGSQVSLELRELLKQVGLVRMTTKHERSVTLRPDSAAPEIRERVVTVFLDKDHELGVSLDGSNLVCFTGKHKDFSHFLLFLSDIVRCTITAEINFLVTTIALRYINVFDIENDSLDVMSESLRGVRWKGLGKSHHHHKYAFWCETDRGRLDFRFTTEHGDRQPADLGHAASVFSPKHLRSSDEIVGHLDIFESSKPAKEGLGWEQTKEYLTEMNRTIEAAFINAIDPQALIERFGRTEISV